MGRVQHARDTHGPTVLRGVASGFVITIVLLLVGAPVGVALFGLLFGILYVSVFAPANGTALDHVFTGAAAAIPTWALVSVTVYPSLTGSTPAWTAAGMAALFPELIAWAIGGAACGGIASVIATGPGVDPVDVRDSDELPAVDTRIVIVGGGFAGVAAAKRFEALFGPDPSVELVLVSDTNALLFTPMLAEVAAGSLEPTHITSPYRATLRRTKVVKAAVTDADFESRRIFLETTEATASGTSAANEPATDDDTVEDEPVEDEPRVNGGTALREEIEYDHLILATGATTNYFGMDDVESFSFELKTLRDAMRIRNHVIHCFERAERSDDPARQRELLTFVVTGGGFAGTELAGALNDFVHELLAFYPDLPPDAVSVTLVHSGDRLMPALTESLSEYALDRLAERGVDVRLGTRVSGADPDRNRVILTEGGRIGTETMVWTAGVRPDPLIEKLDVPHADSGAVAAEPTYAVPGRRNVWAAGDCALVDDPETGDRHPPTAQYATRAGKHLANNVHRSIAGRELVPMSYTSQGTLAVIGHQSACAELAGRQFSGLFAWFLWRGVYLSKLPGTDRKIRVLVNWFVELLFPRDMVMTMDLERGVDR